MCRLPDLSIQCQLMAKMGNIISSPVLRDVALIKVNKSLCCNECFIALNLLTFGNVARISDELSTIGCRSHI